MSNTIFVGLVILAAGVLAGWFYFKGKPVLPIFMKTTIQTFPTPSGSNLGAPDVSEGATQTGLEKGGVVTRTVITFSDSGFSPSPVTVKAGTVVTFVNESSGPMWVASDPHPTHTILPGFDQLSSVGKGGTYEYAFAKIGTWTYHNHINPTIKGTVVVTE